VAGIDISPLGSFVAPEGNGSVTIADSAEITVKVPIEFRAVTLKRILWLTSLEARR
jgi:hypothetical protein